MQEHVWPVRLLMLILALPFLFTLPQQAAQAEVENGRYIWSENVKDVNGHEVVTHPNGSVTVADCTNISPPNAKTFNALGVAEGTSVSHADVRFCPERERAADGNGLFYGITQTGSTVLAFKNGTKVWEQSLEVCGQKLKPRQLVFGADGYLYALTSAGSACGAAHSYIFRLSRNDGSYGAPFKANPEAYWLVAYRDGVIASSSEQAMYFRYNGAHLATVQHEGGVPEGSTMDGKLYFHSYRSIPPGEDDCNGADYRRYTIKGYGPSGKVFHYDVLRCTSFQDVVVASNGAVVLVSFDYKKEYALRSITVNNGTYRTIRVALPKSDGHRTFLERGVAPKLIPDAKGNVLLQRRFDFAHGLPDGNDDRRSGVKFEVRSAASLRVSGQFSTDEIAATSTFALYGGNAVGIANNRLYFMARSCDSDSCTAESPLRLYAVSMAVAMDYPRGALQPAKTPTATCPSLLFVGVRGSGESADSMNGLGSTVGDVHSQLVQQFPKMKTAAIDYAAVNIGYGNWVGYAAEYNRSVEGGKQNLRNYLDYIIDACPNVNIVGVGYSQGAHVVGDVLGDLPAETQERVAAMVLMGDPRFNSQQSEVNDGSYHESRSGIHSALGYSQPRQIPASLVGVARSYCLAKDPICNYEPSDLLGCAANPGECTHAKYLPSWTRFASEWAGQRAS